MATYDVCSGKILARVFVKGKQKSKPFDNKEDAKLWAPSYEDIVKSAIARKGFALSLFVNFLVSSTPHFLIDIWQVSNFDEWLYSV